MLRRLLARAFAAAKGVLRRPRNTSMRAYRQDVAPFRGESIFGAVVCRTEHENLHAGIFYRDSEHVRQLHLGWEDALSNDWAWGGVWATPVAPPEKLVSAAGMARLVWRVFQVSRRFPYGLGLGDTTFDALGRLQPGKDRRGLTCATLIVAILRSAKVELVEEDTWPIRTDDDRKFLNFVREFAAPAHFRVLEEEVRRGVRRIWPDEVVASCGCDAIPIRFPQARRAANSILDMLDA